MSIFPRQSRSFHSVQVPADTSLQNQSSPEMGSLARFLLFLKPPCWFPSPQVPLCEFPDLTLTLSTGQAPPLSMRKHMPYSCLSCCCFLQDTLLLADICIPSSRTCSRRFFPPRAKNWTRWTEYGVKVYLNNKHKEKPCTFSSWARLGIDVD